MSAKMSPIFPIPEPHHFSDYGFDPQLDFFQVLGEARRHKRDAAAARPIDSVHFKLQKPISKDDHHHNKSKRSFSSSSSSSSSHHKFKSKTRWWRNALLFFKRWAHHHHHHQRCDRTEDPRPFRGSVSGPVYLAESRSGPPGTPYRTASRPSSGPLAGTVTPARKGDEEVPYVSLRDLNVEPPRRISTSSAIPIYLVT
ncbi:uncharacterized protein LOC115751766 [Rhodamnia argentea]|uniref:Uncharacterized protein LOC115751766 n=1 Tax=Rhodamnia argentea TaxID=178133 RepID=A0A8B8QES1_9MYRT|nr:uncharacterized protein LOC115751766 [Rhodamnia argentea]